MTAVKTNKVRIVVVGLGARSRHWLEVLKREPRCEVVALCDPNPEARTRAGLELPHVPTFETLEEGLEQVEADALLLITPPDTRTPHIQLACEKTLALLVEKPLADTLAEAETFVARAQAANIPLMVGLNFRYLGVTRAVCQLLKQKTVGDAAFARFTYERYRDGRAPHLNKYPLTMAHPMLWEQSIHHFDLLRFVYSQEVASVYCQTWNPSWSHYAHDTNVSAVFTLTNGMVVNYQGIWQSGWREPHFEWRTDCTEGVILQREQFGELSYSLRDSAELTKVSLPPHETWISDTAGVLAAFLETLLEGATLQCSGRDHLESLRIVDACIRSSERNEVVTISHSSLKGGDYGLVVAS